MRDAGSHATVAPAEISLAALDDGTLQIRLAGDWLLTGQLPSADEAILRLDATPGPRGLAFATASLGDWDSSLLVPLTHLLEAAQRRNIAVDRSGLPEGILRLVALAEAVPAKTDARTLEERVSPLVKLGRSTLSANESMGEMVGFLGATTIGLWRFITGRAQYRRVDLFMAIQQAGAEALGIVSLVSLLLGAILAFVGAVQLQQFGAAIFVADLVAIAMVREMGALMTGIVMSGRSGAAYAAQLGSMKVTQEIDALQTTGISPIEFLVVPRVVALVLMMPLLTLYANIMGILGGALVGMTMLNISATAYVQQTISALSFDQLLGGLLKATTYGVLVALAGCLRGMQSGRSSLAVGDAATSAVVTGIVSIIAAAGLYAVIFYVLGI